MTTLPPDLIIAVVAIVVVAIVFAVRLLSGRGAAAASVRRDSVPSRPSGPPSSRPSEPSSLTSPLSEMPDDLDFDGATGPVMPMAATTGPSMTIAATNGSVAPKSAVSESATKSSDSAPATPSAPVLPTTSAPPAPAIIAWPLLVSADAIDLDEAARVRLLGDLGIVRAPWCVPILLRACEEETNPAVRRAALGALGGFRASADARSALELAVAANDADERAIASAALRTFD